MTSKDALKEIMKNISETEKEITEIYEMSKLEKPIANDVVLAKRNMCYNKIRMLTDKFKKDKEGES